MKNLPEQVRQKRDEWYDRHSSTKDQPILKRLLTESTDMLGVWKELEGKLFSNSTYWDNFISTVIYCAKLYFREEELRQERNEINDLAKRTAKKLGELVKLFDKFEELHERNSDDFESFELSVFEVINQSARDNGSYESYIKPKVDDFLNQYINCRYYPELTDVFKYLERTFKGYKAKTPRNISPRLFCNKFVEEIKQDSRTNNFPDGFRISDRTMASITKTALALGQDFTEENVKSYHLWRHVK
jgi:hypothetical protein